MGEARKFPQKRPTHRLLATDYMNGSRAEGEPMKLTLSFSAAIADRITVAAGYSDKSPRKWPKDAVEAVLNFAPNEGKSS